jgi:dTDP-glucose pyrophosphorylase
LRSTDCSGRKPKAPPSRGPLWTLRPSRGRYHRRLRPSSRTELEITDANRIYREMSVLRVERPGRAGLTPARRTRARPSTSARASESIGLIDRDRLRELAGTLDKSPYGGYLRADAGNHR